MKKAKTWIAGGIALGIIIYLFTPGLKHLAADPSGWNLQAQFMYFTGMLTMTLMILSMLISLRLPKLNTLFAGLDKAYEVHKWTGIFTTAFVVIHWFGDKIPLVLVKTGVVPDAIIDVNLYTKTEIILYKSGTVLAELFFYVFIFLIVVSLSKKSPINFSEAHINLFPTCF